MHLVAALLFYVVLVFFLLLLVRLVLDWVQFFARDWQPVGGRAGDRRGDVHGDGPAAAALRRILPPVGIGSVRLDLAFLVLLSCGCSLS